MADLDLLRENIRDAHHRDEAGLLADLIAAEPVDAAARVRASARAVKMIEGVRGHASPGLMEVFLSEYGLSTDEGIALMCLAEALLRVPDKDTIDELIEDKIASSSWDEHLGQSASSLVNASTWALMLTGRVLKEDHQPGIAATLHAAVKRLGEPMIRTAVGRAIKELGHQFVLGQTIGEALKRGSKMVAQGYSYSFDMLGEAALTAKDAQHHYDAYAGAIRRLATECRSDDIRENPGISIKLSALHPRYEVQQRGRVMQELVERTYELALMAKKAGMGLNIDAEEADRLDLSLDIIEAVLSRPDLEGWDGFGVVVQAYGKRAPYVLDWLHALAAKLDRKIMVRLVKGAYWDTEIKRAQVFGLGGYPVYTRKVATDVAYMCCAKKLLGMTDRIYPQFATHNAHTVAAVLEMAPDRGAFEFQRLHGMGEVMHSAVLTAERTRCRIYAPVGAHRDLLAYLVRRMLENGANSSFVNQIVNEDVAPEAIAVDPFEALAEVQGKPAPLPMPSGIFGARRNSKGWDIRDPRDLAEFEAAREAFAGKRWSVGPVLAGKAKGAGSHEVYNPASAGDVVGEVVWASAEDAAAALKAAKLWQAPAAERAAVLRRVADLYEANFGEFFAVLAREAGKSAADAISELREAVDFLRYYADRGEELTGEARGVVTCVSPWNFPLAIFTGQIAAALAAGNAVLAKPAEQTGITAAIAVRLMHEAGVPVAALQLLPGEGGVVGAALTGDTRVAGVVFTGSTDTAQAINRGMAGVVDPHAPLIAETGGLNAMIVDSTAMPEQAVRDIVASAFQSAGQRCSALRVLYLQEDVAKPFLEMLYGAMDELVLGDPWELACDVGPVIDAEARAGIVAHIEAARGEGRVLKQLPAPEMGTFVGPAVLRVNGIGDLDREIFGPVLHVATYRADEIGRVIDAINATGYGLTFGMHSRIDNRVDMATARIRAGNIYINRNQIGAVVGSQPFGGEGLSGTGPKAGGPDYVARFVKAKLREGAVVAGKAADPAAVQAALNAARGPGEMLAAQSLPGPTGESNRLMRFGRGTVLCLGPALADAEEQARIAWANGCAAVTVVPGGDVDGVLDRTELGRLQGFDLVALWSDLADLRAARMALAGRAGALVQLASDLDLGPRCHLERHVCIDTTARGGNA
ncbi:MAG: bifunctional proline dehydrogenase/L-glutamate gamma-semialdehyde dehydrogenase PutA [Paracoccaceae bacterium]